ncbi:MAG: hypothetical protein GY893_11120 [bacterium]|nr:hypothetical protein [bacterium]
MVVGALVVVVGALVVVGRAVVVETVSISEFFEQLESTKQKTIKKEIKPFFLILPSKNKRN